MCAAWHYKSELLLEALLDQSDCSPAFVELPVPQMKHEENKTMDESAVAAVLKGKNQLILEITNQASDSFLESILGAMIHAQ